MEDIQTGSTADLTVLPAFKNLTQAHTCFLLLPRRVARVACLFGILEGSFALHCLCGLPQAPQRQMRVAGSRGSPPFSQDHAFLLSLAGTTAVKVMAWVLLLVASRYSASVPSGSSKFVACRE